MSCAIWLRRLSSSRRIRAPVTISLSSVLSLARSSLDIRTDSTAASLGYDSPQAASYPVNCVQVNIIINRYLFKFKDRRGAASSMVNPRPRFRLPAFWAAVPSTRPATLTATSRGMTVAQSGLGLWSRRARVLPPSRYPSASFRDVAEGLGERRTLQETRETRDQLRRRRYTPAPETTASTSFNVLLTAFRIWSSVCFFRPSFTSPSGSPKSTLLPSSLHGKISKPPDEETRDANSHERQHQSEFECVGQSTMPLRCLCLFQSLGSVCARRASSGL